MKNRKEIDFISRNEKVVEKIFDSIFKIQGAKKMQGLIFWVYRLVQFLKDNQVKLSKKILFLLPIIYIVSPITIIPYLFFPVIGWVDNLIVFIFMCYFLKKILARYDPPKSNSQKNNKDTIDLDDDDYQVE